MFKMIFVLFTITLEQNVCGYCTAVLNKFYLPPERPQQALDLLQKDYRICHLFEP